MRVKIDNGGQPPDFGEFLGLISDEHGTVEAVVRVARLGLYLQAVHPSRLTFVTTEQEQEHKE